MLRQYRKASSRIRSSTLVAPDNSSIIWSIASMDTSVYISHQNTESALDRAFQFGGTFAKDCWLQPDGTTLRIDLALAEQVMIDGIMPEDDGSVQGEARQPPIRIDRTYHLSPEDQSEWLQIGMEFGRKYREADGIKERAKVIADQEATAKQFRMRVLEGLIKADTLTGAIVFGDGFPEALRRPDGLHRFGTVLIHASHPANAEELYLRESQCTVDRIIRYRVPGLDDAAWMRQDEPRGIMDVIGWRKYVA
jgi:hypothetical protein